MNFDPVAFWQASGRDPTHREHELNFRHTPAFEAQERALLNVLSGLEFASILEAGCGFGRVTALVHERWPDAEYVAFDPVRERVESARNKAPDVSFRITDIAGLRTTRRFDLVLTVETLMHIPPDEIEAAVRKLRERSKRHLVTLDWAVPLGGAPIAPWNWLHDYEALGLTRIQTFGRQAIFMADAE